MKTLLVVAHIFISDYRLKTNDPAKDASPLAIELMGIFLANH